MGRKEKLALAAPPAELKHAMELLGKYGGDPAMVQEVIPNSAVGAAAQKDGTLRAGISNTHLGAVGSASQVRSGNPRQTQEKDRT